MRTRVNLGIDDGTRAAGWVPPDALFLDEEPNQTELEGQKLQSMVVGGYSGAGPSNIGQAMTRLEVSAELRGGGDYGAATPAWLGTLMRICGLQQTIDYQMRATVYVPPSDMIEKGAVSWLTWGNRFRERGVRFTARNARGNWTFQLPGGQNPKLRGNIMGQYEPPVSNLAIDPIVFAENRLGRIQACGFANRGTVSVVLDNGTDVATELHNFEFTGNNDVQPIEYMSGEGGRVEAIGQRGDISGSMEVEFLNEQKQQWFRMATERGHFGIRILLGTSRGDVVGIRMKRVQPMPATIGEKGPLKITTVPFDVLTFGEATEFEVCFFTHSRAELEALTTSYVMKIAAGNAPTYEEEFAAKWIGPAEVWKSPARPPMLVGYDESQVAGSAADYLGTATAPAVKYTGKPAVGDIVLSEQVLTGTVSALAPQPAVGAEGDYHLDTASSAVYRRGEAAWVVVQVENGIYYADNASETVYRKVADVFGVIASIAYFSRGFPGVLTAPVAGIGANNVLVFQYPVVDNRRVSEVRKGDYPNEEKIASVAARGDVVDADGNVRENVVFAFTEAVASGVDMRIY